MALALELSWRAGLAPTIKMYGVTGRMVDYTLWLIAERVATAAAALYIAIAPGVDSISTGIVVYGVLSAGLVSLTLVASAISQNSSDALAATNRRAAGTSGSGISNSGSSSNRTPNSRTVTMPITVASTSAGS